jgi:hypothetical protein
MNIEDDETLDRHPQQLFDIGDSVYYMVEHFCENSGRWHGSKERIFKDIKGAVKCKERWKDCRAICRIIRLAQVNIVNDEGDTIYED